MKYLRQVFFFFCFYFSAAQFSFSQNYDYRAPIPPTPEAAALAKFAQVPVSYSTGTPNITIPLYEIKLRDVTLPVSLNYHAGGVKVDEIASSIGLGWSLSAGGSVSSTVHDKPDFGPYGYATGNQDGFFPIDRELIPYRGRMPFPAGTDSLMAADYDFVAKLLGMTTVTTQDPNAAFDIQPDLFYYSLGGRSGKFFHTREGEAHTVPFEPLSISHGQGIRFTITDEQGVKYTFSDREVSMTYYETFGVKSGPQTSGAYTPYTYVYNLSSIQTPSGDSIWFEYETVRYNYRNQTSYTRYLKHPGQTCDTNYDSRTESLTDVLNGLRLKSIKSSLGHEVSFRYSSCDRADLPGTYALKEVEVKAAGTVQRKLFHLSHSYFYSNSLAEPVLDDCTATDLPPESLRLKLLAVEEEGKPPYRIEYNEAVRLPSRMAQAQDHWGFYNGTTSLLPKDIIRGFQEGGNRSASEELMGAWSIVKTTYPTGGFTEFEFEPHDAYYTRNEVTEEYRKASYYNSDYLPTTDPVVRETEFEVGFTVAAYGVTARYEVSDASLLSNDYVRAEIKGVSDPGFNKLFTKSSPVEGERLQLLPGRYKLVVEAKGVYDDAFVLLHWYETEQRAVTDNQIAGGLRVKKITDYSIYGPPMVKEFKYRLLEDTSRSSGKVLFLPEYISMSSVWTGLMEDGTAAKYYDFCEYTVQSSRSTTPLSTLSGSSVAYTAVGVLSGIGKQKIYSTYRYSFEEDHAPHAGPPFTPPTSLEWARGQLLEETDYLYNPDAQSFLPLRRKKHTYSRHYTPPRGAGESGNYYNPSGTNESHALGLQIMVTRPGYQYFNGSCDFCFQSALFQIESFKLVSVWQYLASTEEILYDNGDTSRYVATTTNYSYDNPHHAQLTRVSKNDSKGEVVSTNITYPGDYITVASPSPAGLLALGVKTLLENHVIGRAVEQTEWVLSGGDSTLLSANLSLYEPFGSFTTLRKVMRVESTVPTRGLDFSPAHLNGQGELIYDQMYKEEYYFSRYSSLLNPLEFSKGGFTTSLIWDESVGVVIAEVRGGATVDQIAYTGFENGASNGGWILSGTRSKDGGARTGYWHFSGIVSTSGGLELTGGAYEVSLWAKGGGSVTVNGHSKTVSVDWERLTFSLESPGQVKISCSASTLIDELRLIPVGAHMTTYTYDPMAGITSQTDSNGRIMLYTYDSFGRLKAIKDEEGNVMKSYEYNYKSE